MPLSLLLTAIDSGDGSAPALLVATFFAALILLVHAGLALNEAGFTRARNAGTAMLRIFASLSLGGLAFWLVGFGLMFGVSNGFVGWSHFALTPGDAGISVFWLQQTLYAITAGAIASGAGSERMRLPASLITSFCIVLFVYPVAGHWLWGNLLVPENVSSGAWLAHRGFFDFSGSAVVHCCGGFAALAAAMAVGPRMGKFSKDGSVRLIAGHNLTLAFLGGMLIFVGWLGWTGAAAAITPGVPVGRVLMNTILAGFAGSAAAMLTAWFRFGKPDPGMTLSGSVAGLVAVSASCASTYPVFAALIGALAGVLVVGSILMLDRMRVDDPVGMISVHGVCGVFGIFAAAIFHENLFIGKPWDIFERVGAQGLALLVLFVWSFSLTFVLLKAIDLVMGIRLSAEEELTGLDLTELGISAYSDPLSSPASSSVAYRTPVPLPPPAHRSGQRAAEAGS